ncbi:NADPH oxidase regulator NoxR [Coprinellus micaceus]|uniref:NADPH oxidase regulator NoxR n=1 Tax=Coprinellus micaceus TaxID=71717 RepID=A0A4Y7TTD9_COPMI|nr:NADPH oxidase regulator NoxR [Coprinellus micaceus]
MSLKAELETWAAALKAYDEEDFTTSLELFSRIADSSKILTNMGLIYATLGEHQEAVRLFQEATSLDQYLAVAYFQSGVSNFLLGQYETAFREFDETLLYLRGNQTIDYEQLGLKFRLYSAEVLFNRGLCMVNTGQMDKGLQMMQEARREKATEEHNVIDEALADQGQGYTVFSIPVGVLYRPSEKKLKNAVQKDYMGKARLIASSDPNDNITDFTGSARLKMGITPTGIFLNDRPDGDNTTPTVVRSATVPGSMPRPNAVDMPRSAGLERAKTTINVPANARELTSRGPMSAGGSIARSNTQITPGRPSPNAGLGGPGSTRGLSIRRPGAGSPNRGPALPPKEATDGRLTEFYDDYLNGYEDAPPVPEMQPAPTDRVAAWARQNPGYPPSRQGSRSAPGSSYTPSSYAGGSMRRKPTRRPTIRSRIQSSYEEEEEGYGSGEYEDGPLEMNLIRVKLHYKDETRGMTLPPDMPFEEFIEKITAKFEKSFKSLGMKFKDEDGGMVTLRDESDFELAVETAREHSKGKAEGKLEIWCRDI